MTALTMLSGLASVVAWGVLLPASVLTSGWYQLLAAFVAVNTLIYATLSISKLIPKWRPRP